MVTRALLAAVLMSVTSCTSNMSRHVTEVPVRPVAGVREDIRTPDDCTKAEGWWTVVSEGREACVVLAPDSGKECYDDTECQAFCSAEAGTPDGAAAKGRCAIDMRSRCRALHILSGHARVACVE